MSKSFYYFTLHKVPADGSATSFLTGSAGYVGPQEYGRPMPITSDEALQWLRRLAPTWLGNIAVKPNELGVILYQTPGPGQPWKQLSHVIVEALR